MKATTEQTTVKTENDNNVSNNIEQIVLKQKETAPDGGEIVLDTLEKHAKDLNRHELLELARGIKGVTLVVGRKMAKTRLVWGKFVPAHMTNKKATKRAYHHKAKAIVPAQATNNGFESQSPFLKITVGNETQTIPIKLELIGA